jgi:hypothetical protein
MGVTANGQWMDDGDFFETVVVLEFGPCGWYVHALYV